MSATWKTHRRFAARNGIPGIGIIVGLDDRILLTFGAWDALGQPTFVELLVDTERELGGVRPSSDDSRDAYKLHRRLIACVAFINRHLQHAVRGEVIPATVDEDGVLTFSLPKARGAAS